MKRFKVRQSSEAVYIIDADSEETIRRACTTGDFSDVGEILVGECLASGESPKIISIEEIP